MDYRKISLLTVLSVLTACGTTKIEADDSGQAIQQPDRQRRGRGVRAMPFACIYRTNGDYNNHVTVSTDPATGNIVAFPATTDVGVESAPMILTDGWLLDRRGGIGYGTAFLRWTYAEYRAMPATPSLDEMRDAIIPGARVTAIERLDMTTFAAQTDTAAVNRIIRAGF